MRLLLVEDNVPLADELVASLSRQGYATDWLTDGRDAEYQGATEPHDLIISTRIARQAGWRCCTPGAPPASPHRY